MTRANLATEGWYRKGREARMRGLAKDACPAAEGTPARTAWIAGWGHRDLELRSVGLAAGQIEGPAFAEATADKMEAGDG